MNNKTIFGLLLNPFTRFAGWQAFGLGIVFVGIMGVIGTFSNVAFDGALDMHISPQMTFAKSFTFLAIDIFSVVATMWIMALLVSKGFRLVDLLGTMVLAKAPLIILALAGFIVQAPDLTASIKDPTQLYRSSSILLLSLLSLPILIWNITLMLNAFKVSCDVKGSKLTIAFIIAIIVSEIISKIIIAGLM